MAESTNQKPQKFYEGTNFWFALLMVGLSFFGGGENTAQALVTAGVGVVAAIGVFRQFLVNAKWKGLKATLAEPNTWNYIGGVILTILPQATDLIPALHGVYDALITGNWGLVISRGIALLTIIYYLFVKKT